MADILSWLRGVNGLSNNAMFHRSGRPFGMDESTYAMLTMDYPHHEIHAGRSYAVNVFNTTANLDDQRTLIGFETSASLEVPHLTITVYAASGAEACLVEGVVIDDNAGTDIPIENRLRSSANEALVLSFENPAVAGLATWMDEGQVAGASFSFATELDRMQMVAGSGPKPLGGSDRSTQEWVLDPSTKYAVFVQNVGANANLHGINMNFYEHEPKE